MDPERVIEQLRELFAFEYSNLCSRLDLVELPLDVFIVVPESSELTAFNNKLGHGTPSYTPTCIILPYEREPLRFMRPEDLQFSTSEWIAPAVWTKNDWRFETVWPEWRLAIWHETCHQLEQQLSGEFHGGNEHGETWRTALAFLASRFDVDSTPPRVF